MLKAFDVQIMIVASESIRQINDANIHGSPNDFFDWMRVLGYVWGTERNVY